jgi:hypothetical protein
MSKKKEYIEEQKGPIDMAEQYTMKFHREPEHTMQDLINNTMRQDKMTMEYHTPKR